MEGEAIRTKRRWLPRWLRILLAILLLVLLVGFAILWALRVQLATAYIDGELARRGIDARYEVRRIGFGSQIFENLSIGDPRRPDLTAERVEVGIRFGLTGVGVGLIKARGVRMRGRVVDGRLTLGQIDRLLPPPSGEPFRLPDQRIDVENAAIALETPAGDVALALSGRGNLADGFRGGLALAGRRLRLGDCEIERPIARFLVRVTGRRPRLRGPAAMARLSCANGLAVERPLLALRAILEPGLDGWRGSSAMRVAALGMGARRVERFQGHVTFAGNARGVTGRLDFASGPAEAGIARAGATRFDGRYALALQDEGVLIDGRLETREMVLAAAVAPAVAALRGAEGTPVGPAGAALASALERAGRGASAAGDLLLVNWRGEGRVRLAGLGLDSASGARLAVAGGEGVSYAWPSGAVRLDGLLTLSGGGFPDARFALAQRGPGAPLSGSGRIAPILAGGTRLALGEIAFATDAAGRTVFRTAALIDGPVPGGRVSGLALPLSGRFGAGGFALGESCVPAGFRALEIENLRIGPTLARLCPTGRALMSSGPRGFALGAEIGAPRFAGRLGSSPIAIAAARLRVDQNGFAAARVAVRLAANRLDMAEFGGRFGGGGVAGAFAGLGGDIANVPLLVGDGRGRWRFARGRLDMEGRLNVADRQAPLRFHPLTSSDFRLALANNRIHATGTLVHPASGTRVMAASIDHDLGHGAGGATLDVEALRFAPTGLQPEMLTPLTVGVVALVDGAVSGQGRIEWDARGTRSAGSFATDDMDLAAPFGPVEGLATRIDFTDLLGLTTAPGQQARVRLVRAGIDVYDGVVRYQLRPNYHVAIEDARWPFAGGTLALAPTVLDFSRESTKYLTFNVEALDAARFVQMMEFSNISATGIYDGVIPMQFTDRGGRIVNGRLVARPGGGTLSYVGELTQEDLGAYGALAFDALKSLRYSRLELTLDGALDGEFLTRINMDGIARDLAGTRQPTGGVAGMVVGRVLNQVARIPFHFNIRIQGPFRALVATTRSFQDPSELIRAALPGLLEGQTTAEPAVQPQESDPVR